MVIMWEQLQFNLKKSEYKPFLIRKVRGGEYSPPLQRRNKHESQRNKKVIKWSLQD